MTTHEVKKMNINSDSDIPSIKTFVFLDLEATGLPSK